MRDIMKDMRYSVFWSPDDGEWVATVEQFPSLSWLQTDPISALSGLIHMVEEEVREMSRAELGGEA